MPRFAIGDLFVDLEVPTGLRASYSESGALLLDDRDELYLIEVSGITVTNKDPSVRIACVLSTEKMAKELQVPCVELAADKNYYIEFKSGEWNGDIRLYQHWHVGFRNRALILTLSYPEPNSRQINLPAIHALIESSIRSIQVTHEELPPSKDTAITRDLAKSQLLWLEDHVTRLAGRVHRQLGFDGDGLPPLEVLDEYWSRFIANPPLKQIERDSILNGVGVALGYHLVQGKGFEWIVLSDEYGTCIGVVALRGVSEVHIDPINFVVKRWETKEPTFLVHGFSELCKFVDRTAAGE